MSHRPLLMIHGAWHYGAVWNQTIAELLKANPDWTVSVPDLMGMGEWRGRNDTPKRIGLREHVAQIKQAILTENAPPIDVVAHSYAGVVLCQVVTELLVEGHGARIAHLVLLDAMLPHPGNDTLESLFAITPPDYARRWNRQVKRKVLKSLIWGRTGWLPTPPVKLMLGEDCWQQYQTQSEFLGQTMTPFPMWAREGRQHITPPPHDYPVTYIQCDSELSQGGFAEYAESQDWPVYHLNDQPHDVMLTAPEGLARVLASILLPLAEEAEAHAS